MKSWLACPVLAMAMAMAMVACRSPPRPALDTPGPSSSTVEELTAAITLDSRRSDAESDSRVRAELAEDATRRAGECLARAPRSAACLYGQGIALGLQAKAHPTRAGELLKNMLEALSSAASVDPTYDEAGPARVRGLVLVRAPGWPLGPGDPEAGLAAARDAVSLRPQYPPNLLALAEALSKNGNLAAARESYERARAAAQSLAPSSDRDGWLRQADQALRR